MEYAQITELSRRVSEWEDRVIPKLQEEVCSTFNQIFYVILIFGGKDVMLQNQHVSPWIQSWSTSFEKRVTESLTGLSYMHRVMTS